MRQIIKVAILLLFTAQLNAQLAEQLAVEKINPALLTAKWPAQWITHPSASVVDYGVFHFRKTFDLKDKPGSFIINVSADNRYRLFVNGTAVCAGPARSDPEHWTFETIDIAPFLKQGRNTIASVVWNFGPSKPWAQFSIKTAFIMQGNSDNEKIINTDRSWKVMIDKSYSPAPATTKETSGQFVVVGPCDRVDASLYPWGWEKESFDDSAWEKPKTLDTAHPFSVGTDINWELTPRKIPLMELKKQTFGTVRRNSGTTVPDGFLNGKNSWKIAPSSSVTVLIDQGKLTTAYPELLVSGGKGSSIKVIYAESLFNPDGSKGNRNEIEGKNIKGYSDYFLPDGKNDRLFRTLWFRTWRYVQLEIRTDKEPLTINNFSSEFTAYPLAENARFESDMPELQKIWETGWRTARLCANETYFDCPYYEQLQYVGDTRIQSLISLYVSGDDRLVRKALSNFNESIFFEGLTRSRYPSANPQIIPPFSLYWVDMVNDYWMLRDDREFISTFLPGIESVLGWFTRHLDKQTGMLGKLDYWNFVDWANEWAWNEKSGMGGVPAGGLRDGNSSILSMQFAYALQKSAELFSYFGDQSKADKYNHLADEITTSVMKNCWDPTHGYIADTPDRKSFSMHAQIFAVLTNTIAKADQAEYIKKFINDGKLIQPTMYFRFYLTQALKQAGLADLYTNTLGLWHEMLKNGLSTFAENPDPARSDCHAWSASPNYDLIATVAGIRPASPGFRTVVIEPAPGPLKFIKGQMPHPAGTISFSLSTSGTSGIKGQVTLPAGINGTFRWHGKEITLKGTTDIDL